VRAGRGGEAWVEPSMHGRTGGVSLGCDTGIQDLHPVRWKSDAAADRASACAPPLRSYRPVICPSSATAPRRSGVDRRQSGSGFARRATQSPQFCLSLWASSPAPRILPPERREPDCRIPRRASARSANLRGQVGRPLHDTLSHTDHKAAAVSALATRRISIIRSMLLNGGPAGYASCCSIIKSILIWLCPCRSVRAPPDSDQ